MFHSRRLRLAATNPLPSQHTTDFQPEPKLIDSIEEYRVEKVLERRTVRRGRGQQRQVLVKWTGYADPTWEPETALQNTIALEAYKALEQEGRRGVM